MANKTKFSDEPFKLQVYVDRSVVEAIDKICSEENIYRSGFVTEAIARQLKLARYKKILESK